MYEPTSFLVQNTDRQVDFCAVLFSAISVLKRILNHPVSFPELCYKYKETAAVSNAMNICSVIIYKLIIYLGGYSFFTQVFPLFPFLLRKQLLDMVYELCGAFLQ